MNGIDRAIQVLIDERSEMSRIVTFQLPLNMNCTCGTQFQVILRNDFTWDILCTECHFYKYRYTEGKGKVLLNGEHKTKHE